MFHLTEDDGSGSHAFVRRVLLSVETKERMEDFQIMSLVIKCLQPFLWW